MNFGVAVISLTVLIKSMSEMKEEDGVDSPLSDEEVISLKEFFKKHDSAEFDFLL